MPLSVYNPMMFYHIGAYKRPASYDFIQAYLVNIL